MKKQLILIFLILLISPAYAALLVDNCETGTTVNTLGGPSYMFDDGESSITFTADSTPGFNSTYAKTINITAIKAASAYAGYVTYFNSSQNPLDLSSYKGVRFYAKGYQGYTVALPMTTTASEYNHYTTSINVTSSWKLYELPFTDFTQYSGTPTGWDPESVTGVVFTGAWNAGTQGELYLDDIEFYTAAEEINTVSAYFVSSKPKVNQVGYFTAAKKYFTVITQTAGVSDTFYIKNASNSVTVYTGAISGSIISDAAAGEDVVQGEFTAFNTPGRYFVEVNGETSYYFNINDSVMNDVFVDSLRAFYIIRANDALSDTVTGISHPASHQSDASFDNTAGSRDLRGGWYNAGDFGKWVHEASFSVAYMLWLYELKTADMQGLNITIPESDNGVSDILNEARWGLEWILKMQNPDGSVYHKVDTEPNFAWGTAPDLDPYARSAKCQGLGSTQFSTIDAADTAAVMAQAYRVFSSVDAAFAARCSAAAQAAWDWLDANPKTGQTDPYYTDADYWEEVMWARAEMFSLTNDPAHSSAFDTELDARIMVYPNWQSPHFFGYMSMYFNPNTPQAIKDKIEIKALQSANTYKNNAVASGYNVAAAPADYWWGSTTTFMGRGNVFIFAYYLSGDASWLDYALYQLDFMSGLNSLEQMFYSGYGTKQNNNPYHWSKFVYDNPVPGWVTGGPNPNPAGADGPLIALQNSGAPAQKCWLDMCESNGSWASNEGTTDQNAALVFLSGYFYNNPATPVETPTETLTETSTETSTETPTLIYTYTETPTHTPVPTETEIPDVKNNLDEVFVFPSRYTGKESDSILFGNLTSSSVVQIFNIRGDLVHSGKATDGSYIWKIGGRPKLDKIASGIYIFAITDDDGNISKGKFVVVN